MRPKKWRAERRKDPPERPIYVGPPVKVGDVVTRRSVSLSDHSTTWEKRAKEMTGIVVYIHPKGRFHTVEFNCRGNILRECFCGVREERGEASA